MTRIAEELKPHLSSLPHEDKVELANFLMDCLEKEEDPEWQAAWTAELARREESVARGDASYHPAEKVLAKLRKKSG